MLFNQNIEPKCRYCRSSLSLGRNEYACVKHGIMHGDGYCGLFRYEPTKRTPPELPKIGAIGLSERDFAL